MFCKGKLLYLQAGKGKFCYLQVGKGKLVALGSVHMFGDQYIDKEENHKILVSSLSI